MKELSYAGHKFLEGERMLKLDKVSKSLWSFLESNKKKIRHIVGTDIIIDRLAMMTDIYMPAMVQHQKVFPKYKGINKGKTVVITGTGPTFDYYNPVSNVVHMGLNDAIFREDIRYDYFFACDYVNQIKLFEKILNYGDDLVKFMGINYRGKNCLIPEYLRDRQDVEMFYVDSYDYGLYGRRFENTRKFVFPLDISVSPFKSYATSLYIVFQFALWTHPDKIYLVGADCYGTGHASKIKIDDKGEFDARWYIRPWRKLAEFARANYPDIEIISINPVGLKGVFKDEYTQEYKMSLKK